MAEVVIDNDQMELRSLVADELHRRGMSPLDALALGRAILVDAVANLAAANPQADLLRLIDGTASILRDELRQRLLQPSAVGEA